MVVSDEDRICGWIPFRFVYDMILIEASELEELDSRNDRMTRYG